MMCLLLGASSVLHAAGNVDPFVAVAIDARTELSAGSWKRDHLQTLLQAMRNTGQRSLLLKSRLDNPQTPASDAALASAIKNSSAILQGKITRIDAAARPLSARFHFSTGATVTATMIEGPLGVLPLQEFADAAQDICFADSEEDRASLPLFERYQGKLVKTMYLCALERAANAKTRIETGGICLGRDFFTVNSDWQFPLPKPLAAMPKQISVVDVISGNDAAALKDKVAILIYAGRNASKVDTQYGEITQHEFFVRVVASLWQQRERMSARCKE